MQSTGLLYATLSSPRIARHVEIPDCPVHRRSTAILTDQLQLHRIAYGYRGLSVDIPDVLNRTLGDHGPGDPHGGEKSVDLDPLRIHDVDDLVGGRRWSVDAGADRRHEQEFDGLAVLEFQGQNIARNPNDSPDKCLLALLGQGLESQNMAKGVHLIVGEVLERVLDHCGWSLRRIRDHWFDIAGRILGSWCIGIALLDGGTALLG